MVGCPPPIAECVFTIGKQLQHRRVHPPCHGIFDCQWIGFVEYAVCSNTVQSITHPDRNASTERLKADSDVTAVQATNHRLEIEPLHPHRGSILLHPNHRALRRRRTRCFPAWPPARRPLAARPTSRDILWIPVLNHIAQRRSLLSSSIVAHCPSGFVGRLATPT
jgi:hypothetical protein